MKQLKNIIFIALLSVLAGCSSFLDKPLENTAQTESINYTDLSIMYQPVSGVYRTAAGAAPGFVHWMDYGIRGVRGDDLEKGSTPGDQATLTDIKEFKNNYVSVQTFWGTNNCWTDYYGLIYYCNQALSELDKFAANIEASDASNLALNKRYKAEVRVIRAFAHLVVSRVFGDIPIMGDSTNYNTMRKSTVADVRKYIIDQMDASINDLEDARPNESAHIGAVTKYTALLLKAKAAADLAGADNSSAYWDVVLDCTNQIINSGRFSLYPDYYQLFKRPGKLCNESLYEIQFTDFGTSSGTAVGPDAFFAFQGPRGDQRGSPISGWGFLTPSQKIVDFLTNRNDDIRLKTTILFCGDTKDDFATTPSGDKIYGNTDGLKYFNGKVYLPVSQMTAGRTDYGSDNNVRVMRYAEVLLLNAEAKVRKGQNGDAELNLVRERAGLSDITGATIDNIMDERRAEFACEWWGERYNDLLRTGTAAAVLSDYGFVAGQSDYIPIPQTQVDLNTNLQ